MIVGKCNVDNHVNICIVGGFRLAVKHGALAGEAIWGVRFDLTYVVYSRAPGLDDLPSLAQRVVHASQLSAKRRLMEPFYEINIQTPKEFINTIMTLLTERHGHVFRLTKMQRFGAPLNKIIAYIPVRHAFGFSTELSNASANLGHATTAQCKFNHWEIINSNPTVDDTPANLIVRDVRRRKGLPEPMPQLADFEDIITLKNTQEQMKNTQEHSRTLKNMKNTLAFRENISY
ncbi:hypothetical protein LXL04_023937 [Taraxacum kok-saghyz]